MRKEKPRTTSVPKNPATVKLPSRTTPHKYRTAPLFPRIEAAVLAILTTKNFVAPVDVLVHAGVLRANQVEDWRFGRIPYLEQVTQGNLSKMSRMLRILGFLCHDLNLKPSMTAYVRWGKGPRIPLRFTKTSEPRLEMVYARHFVWPGKIPFHLPEGYQVYGKPNKKDAATNRVVGEPKVSAAGTAPPTETVGT